MEIPGKELKELIEYTSSMKTTEALIRLADFFERQNIKFMVTGTTAMKLLGLPLNSQPGDIDVKIPCLFDSIKDVFESMQTLQGIKTPDYGKGQDCFAFYMDKDTKVNVLVSDSSSFTPGCYVNAFIEGSDAGRIVKVQRIEGAIKDKMKLGRNKDKEFMLNLIQWLSNLNK